MMGAGSMMVLASPFVCLPAACGPASELAGERVGRLAR